MAGEVSARPRKVLLAAQPLLHVAIDRCRSWYWLPVFFVSRIEADHAILQVNLRPFHFQARRPSDSRCGYAITKRHLRETGEFRPAPFHIRQIQGIPGGCFSSPDFGMWGKRGPHGSAFFFCTPAEGPISGRQNRDRPSSSKRSPCA